MSYHIKLPSRDGGVYLAQVNIGGKPVTLQIEIPECPIGKQTPKPTDLGTFGINDVSSYTNIVDREKWEQQFRAELKASLARPVGQNEGYSNLMAEKGMVPDGPHLTAEEIRRRRGI